MMRRLLVALLLLAAFDLQAQPATRGSGLSRAIADARYLRIAGTLPMTGALRIASGTAAAPGLAFSADADGTGTGVFRSAANVIGFSTNGVERWVINSSGAFNCSTDGGCDIGNGAADPRDLSLKRNLILRGATSGTATVHATAIAGTGDLTLPTGTDTLVGKATTDILTNKSIDLTSNTVTMTSAQARTAYSDESGTGLAVFVGANTDLALIASQTITLSQDGTTSFTVTNTNAGTSAVASLKIQADAPSLTFLSHAAARVATRYGVTVGGNSEILGNAASGKGLVIGTIATSGSVWIGAGSTLLATLNETGVAIGTVAPSGSGRLQILAGSSTTLAKAGGTIAFSSATTGNGAGAETDIRTQTLTASILANDGDGASFVASGSFAATASVNKRIIVYFGGTAVFDSGSLAITSASTWRITSSCDRTSSSAVTCSTTLSSSATGALTAVSQETSVTGLTLTNTQVYKITGNGTNASDVVAHLWKMRWDSAP